MLTELAEAYHQCLKMSVVSIFASQSNHDTHSVWKARRGSLLLSALVALGLCQRRRLPWPGLSTCRLREQWREQLGRCGPRGGRLPTRAHHRDPGRHRHHLGVDVQVTTTGFTVNPSRTPTDPVDGEGHFLLDVDGVGRRRVYQHTFHVEISEPGDHEMQIGLSANNHAPLVFGGDLIEAAVTVTIPEPDAQYELSMGKSEQEKGLPDLGMGPCGHIHCDSPKNRRSIGSRRRSRPIFPSRPGPLAPPARRGFCRRHPERWFHHQPVALPQRSQVGTDRTRSRLRG